ncbi:DcaP family trimeric outer membrane transporter [Rhodoligotrophos defluvii]|uniref:DcaP family trimeric outer membrane transporter n=1 Tax=Rhodoligotrophos defluvii TaxID=2561934 RepID=UPI0010C96D68|nr:DcaP family trimeric outer membrane transporter [Rhodoligotrophos defluvii]
MTSKNIGRVLLGGVALAVLSTGAQADELSQLKAQLEALQAQVNQLEARPAAPTLPEGASWITFRRGTEATADWNTARAGDYIPSSSGVTIAITPSADLPAPVHEVTISGYVKGDVIYDFDQDLGDLFSYTAINGRDDQEHIRLHARQTRFNIKSKSDTAIGQIRTLIEGDFFSGGSFGSTDWRMRHAWGEWDMTPNWTFGAGQTWTNFMSPFTGITTVDFNGDIGLIGASRNAQVRLAWHDGPMLFAVAAEHPRDSWLLTDFGNSSSNIPDFTARWQYDAPGGHKFLISGVLRNYHTDSSLGGSSESELGWGVQGAVNINLADIATLTTAVIYGDGIGGYIFGANRGAYYDGFTGDIETIESMGIFAGLIFNVTDTTSINLGWGYTDQSRSDLLDASWVTGRYDQNVDIMSAHANIIWQPVQQLRLGWEVMWAERQRTVPVFDPAGTLVDAGTRTDDALRAQFGAWFYF